MMNFPRDLQSAIETELQRIPPGQLSIATQSLSTRYRAHRDEADGLLVRTPGEVAAYAAYRLPATYAAIGAVLEEADRSHPHLDPTTMLDVGGGPGTAVWAAADLWPELERATVLERDERMIALGETLAAHASSPAIRDATWQEANVTDEWAADPADLIISAYVIGELQPDDRTQLVRRLWEHTRDTCVIVEPGTPRGYGLIGTATADLVDAGAHIIAPFPHDWRCVEHERDWCHFSVRVPRTRLHRSAKDADLSYEDEKFAYVVASRSPGAPIAARVIRHPQVRKGHVRLTLCTPEGVTEIVVARSNRAAYRLARDLKWGSSIAIEDAALYGLGPG